MNKQKFFLILILLILTVVYQFIFKTDIMYNKVLYVLLTYAFYLVIKYYKEII